MTVFSLCQDKNLDWFPRMRAMSLTNEDGDGEQSDYRNLQAQLDTTNKLVKNLSKQLTELKEQVRFLSDATKLKPLPFSILIFAHDLLQKF